MNAQDLITDFQRTLAFSQDEAVALTLVFNRKVRPVLTRRVAEHGLDGISGFLNELEQAWTAFASATGMPAEFFRDVIRDTYPALDAAWEKPSLAA